MAIDKSGYISIAELIVFIPALLGSLIVCARHGFQRSAGWIYTSVLCAVRIAGAVCQLLSYTDHSPGLVTATIILGSIGLSPLLLASLGLIFRFVNCVNASGKHTIGSRSMRLIQVLVVIATALSIMGSTNATVDATGTVHTPLTAQIGILIYLVALLGICLALFRVLPHRRAVADRESRIRIVITVALPFLGVRILYSILAAFTHNKHFSMYGGSIAVRIAMTTAEEFFVVVMYIILGCTLEKQQAVEKIALNQPEWKFQNVRY